MGANVKIKNSELLSDNWYKLTKVTFQFTLSTGEEITQVREVFDRGNAAAILLYNTEKRTVVLTKQFRLPTYLNGNATGMLIEACAGLLDQDEPEECIRRETSEETGYEIGPCQKVFEAYTSPGAVTEIIHFFIASYHPTMKTAEGGGLQEEQEFIEVLEYNYDEALSMITTGEIKDAKTIMLLQYLRVHAIL